MDHAVLRERRLRTQRAFFRLATALSPGGRVLELDGVTAAIAPSVPERSVFNSVIYDDSDALVEVLPALASAYEEAGIQAWTVWVPGEDRTAAAALRKAGHVLDATPEAMACSVDGAARPDPDPLEDWTREAAMADLARINDRAYPFEADPFTRAWSHVTGGEARAYIARLDGRPAASVMTLDHQGDAGVYAVATVPEARGRGLVTALLAHAVADARERGCETTSLEATQMGRPVYERLGYLPLGPLEMWERRSG